MNFADKTLQRIELASLLIGAGFPLAILIYAGGFKLDGWVFWVISPYVSFYIFSRFILTTGPSAVKAGAYVALQMLLVTVVVYGLSVFVSTSSTSAIVFLFLPAFLLLGGPIHLWAFR